MGGSALETETQRISDDDYQALRPRIRPEITHRTPADKAYVLRSVGEKEDHGDVDVLVQTNDRAGVEEKVQDMFGATETCRNGPAFSIDATVRLSQLTRHWDVGPFQLDLVFVPEEHWEMSKAFFDWNDLGNLLGKVARYHRLKLGFQGLRLPFWHDLEKSQKLGEYVLTRDPAEALKYLGYSYERHQWGFETYEDMFAYALSSEKATPNAFKNSQLTASQRQRDSTRDVYQRFMKWLGRQRPHEHVPRPGYSVALEKANEAFPEANLREKIQRDKNALRERKAASEVFGGGDIRRELGLEGKEIGRLLEHMKELSSNWNATRLSRGREKMLETAETQAKEIGLL